MHTSRSELEIVQLGRMRYAEALALQLELRDARLAGERGDTVLLVEHPDVITLGRSSRSSSVCRSEVELERAGYDVHRVNRGGDVTYHGPGQLVGYPILDLSTRARDVHRYLRELEDVLIDTAADFGVSAGRRSGFTGVWTDERHKLASIGIGVRRWVTLHGFALNVACDLERFLVIVPCGLEGVEMVNLRDLALSSGAVPPSMDEVSCRLSLHLRKAFA